MSKINIGTEIELLDLLQSRMLIQANSGGGKSVLARVIIEETFGKVPFIVMDIEGEYYTLKEKFGDVLIIGGQHADIPISMKSVKLLPKEIISNRLSVVIDLSDLQMNDRVLYAKHFLETMMDLPNQYWLNYLVFIEEAHKLCGEQDKQASATAVKDLMSRGRKRGYCGILLTQRISKLHKDAAAECNNKFIGRTFLDIDLDRAAKELGLSSQDDKNKIRTLEPGSFYAFGTSIKPHYVHIVKVNLPQTKIPKAGVNLDIKPKAPTDKIKTMLAKLNDLPAEAEKELKNIHQLQQEVNRLNHELHKATKAGNTSQTFTKCNNCEGLKARITELQNMVKEREKEILNCTKVAVSRLSVLTKIKNLAAEGIEINIPASVPSKLDAETQHFIETGKSNNRPVNTSHANNGQLGKCSFSILQFLASFPDRQFSKAQVGIAAGYSPGSGGFNNSISELYQKGLIIRNNGKLQAAENLNGFDFQPQKYSIHTFRNKLGKCEREIYDVLLENPNDQFTKEQLAHRTESKYSHGSGGFNNALSTLNTLELIKRERGLIQLNPELLEI